MYFSNTVKCISPEASCNISDYLKFVLYFSNTANSISPETSSSISDQDWPGLLPLLLATRRVSPIGGSPFGGSPIRVSPNGGGPVSISNNYFSDPMTNFQKCQAGGRILEK